MNRQRICLLLLSVLVFLGQANAATLESTFFTRSDQTPPEEVTITGVVLDAKTAEPIIGAAVVLKADMARGVATDVNGKFTFTAPKDVSELEVSFLGYETQTVKVNKQRDLKVLLMPTTFEIEEMVITGMQRKKEEAFTGDYRRVQGEDIIKINPNNVLAALQAFDPSFRILDNNSAGSNPNALPEFRMKGDVQLGTGIDPGNMDIMLGGIANLPNMPLFMLDGFEVSLQRIMELEPERIKEVVILKDAAATAVYGSKASNGIIVFETKAPMPGKLNVIYSTNMGLTVPDLTDYNLMNAEQKLEAEWLAGFYNPNNPTQMNTYNRYKADVMRGVDTYWLSQALQTPLIQRHTLSLQGGATELRYNLSLSHNRNPGVMKKSGRNMTSFNFDLTYRTGKLNIVNSLNLGDNVGNNSPYGSFSQYTRVNPYYRMYDDEGKLIKILDVKNRGVGESSAIISNPLYNATLEHKDRQRSISFTENIMMEYRFLPTLRLSGNLGFIKTFANSEKFLSPNHTSFEIYKDIDLTKRGSYDKSIGEATTWNGNVSIDYNLQKREHTLTMFGRWDISSRVNNALALTAHGYPNEHMNDFLFGFDMPNRPTGGDSKTRSIGLIGQVSYMYATRYSVDLSLRTDLSSSFGADNRLAPFWSLGGRWNVDREKWFTRNDWISELSLRSSIGVTGSQNYSPYQAIQTYTFNHFMHPYVSSDVIGAELMALGNPNLGWSSTLEKSLGVNASFLKNRLHASFSMYDNYTDQLLVDFTAAPSVGFDSYIENAGAIRNTGYQFNVSLFLYENISERIQWIVSLNGANNRNRVEKISNSLEAYNRAALENKNAAPPMYVEGESTSRIFLVPSLGIDPATGQELYLNKDDQPTFIWSAADKRAVGDSNPDLHGNINSSFTYKNLSLSCSFMYEFGAQRYNNTLVEKIENADLAYNADARVLTERWSPDNREALYKAINIKGQSTNASTRFLQDYNEMRFSAISLSYRFEPGVHEFLNRLNIGSMTLSGHMNDIGRFSSIKQERGLDYPFARTFSCSLSIVFK